MDFQLNVDSQDAVSVVKVVGDVDVYTSPVLDDCLQRLVASGNTSLAVDLQDCSYFDSEGIKTLVRALKSAGDHGRLSVCGARGSVLRVFQVSGLGAIFGIVPSVDELEPGDTISGNQWGKDT